MADKPYALRNMGRGRYQVIDRASAAPLGYAVRRFPPRDPPGEHHQYNLWGVTESPTEPPMLYGYETRERAARKLWESRPRVGHDAPEPL